MDRPVVSRGRNLAYLMSALIVGGGFASPALFAQMENRSRLKVDVPPRVTPEAGRLLLIAFRNGRPARQVDFEGSFGRDQTRADGTFVKDLSAGRHVLFLPDLDRQIEFRIVSGEETQVTVHLVDDPKNTKISVSAPEVAKLALNQSIKLKVPFRIVDDVTGSPIPDASILISGHEGTLVTSATGLVDAEISAGQFSAVVFHNDFQPQTLTNLQANTTPQAPVQVKLKRVTNELEELVVLAPKIKGSVSALVEVRRKSSAVTDIVGSEQMARQGDSDAAASLRRVTGLTLMNGKYVYVRGLGERYSGVQLNGFGVPSPEPGRRVVPLDLFPTAILESVVVQKSYSADLPGEFGGGLIQLQTRTLPEQFFFKASFSSSYGDADNRLAYRGGSMDWLGVDDGSRKMPSAIRNALGAGKKLVVRQDGSSDGISESELTALGRSLANNYATSRTSENPPPGFSVSSGNRFRLGTTNLGVSGSLLYGQSADSGTRFNRGLNAVRRGEYAVDYNRDSEYSEEEIRLASQLDLGLALRKGHQLNFSTFLLRQTTNFTKEEVRQDPNSISKIESTTLEWTERQLWTKHLKGQHQVGRNLGQPIELSWQAGWSDAERDSPDRREYSFERTPASYQMRGDSGGNRRTFSELEDRSREYGVDLTLPLSRKVGLLKLKTGVSHMTRERRADVFRLFFVGDTTGDSIEDQLNPGNIGSDGFQLQNLTDAADSYTGAQTIFAQYALIDYNPWSDWSFQAGLRHESSEQIVSTFRYFEPGNPYSESELTMDDVLPAYSVVWKPNDQWRARLAYSETLARPDFRELSEVGFIDDETGYDVKGNSKLKGTVIQNIDQRWEYYFSADEYLSVGGFFKQFTDPIEVMFVPGVNRIQTFANAKGAQNYGAELESRMGLRHLTRTLRRWSVLSNLTLIQSTIELDDATSGTQTSQVRPLQGQSPYVVNLQLQYDRPLWNFSATTLYSIIGKRITEVGTNDIPDTYEQPFHQVDFVASKGIGKTWTVALRAKNILDPSVESRQGETLVRSGKHGRTFGLTMSATY